MRNSLLLCSLLAAVHVTAFAQDRELSVADIVARSSAAVVTIKTFDQAGYEIGLGSGFRVEAGRLVTNAHVVAGASRVEVFDNAEQLLGTSSFAEAVSSTVDLAVLPRLGSRPAQLPIAASLPKVGERIVVIGAPEGLTNTVSDGIVSAIRTSDGRTLLQISAPISPGSSGGPVLNMKGEVVGVSVSILREGQNLNFAVPLTDVVAVLGSPPGRVPFPTESRSTEGSRGRRTTAAAPVPLRIGDLLWKTLTTDDPALSDGRRFDQYRAHFTQGQRVSITASSVDFDAYVYVFRMIGDSLALAASDDDSGGGTDAQVDFVAPRDADYLITVIAADSNRVLGGYLVGASRSTSSGASRASATNSEDRWVHAGSSSTVEFSYDRTRITPLSNDIFRVWIRKTWQTPFTDSSGDTYNLVYSLQDFDCRQRRIRVVELTQYLDDKVVWSSPSSVPGAWSTVIPESVGEEEVSVLCGTVTRRR